MILADKISNERKKCGWSQEELAERMDVSRQSVYKWESAQSIPELSKIVQMASLFNVSTDYLLKDEIEFNEPVLPEPEEKASSAEEKKILRRLSLQEAIAFMDGEKARAPKFALGVALCILSPVVLIFLAGLSEEGFISEVGAVGVGLLCLFSLIACAIYLFMTSGRRHEDFEWIEKEGFDSEYGVSGVAKERKAALRETKIKYDTLSVIMYIMCPVPLIITALLGLSDYIVVGMVCVLLFIVASATYMLIVVSIENDGYRMVLEEGEFSVKEKSSSRRQSVLQEIYWPLVLAIYLGSSFITGRWDRTWIIWPVAAILSGVLSPLVRYFTGAEE